MADSTQSKYYQEGLNNIKNSKNPIPEDEQKAYAQAYAEARANGADKKEAAAAGEKAIKKRKELKVNAKKAAEAAKEAKDRIEKQKQEQQDRANMAPSEESRQQSLVAGASMGPSYNTTDANAQGVSGESNSTIEKEKLAFSIYYAIEDSEAKTGQRQAEKIQHMVNTFIYGTEALLSSFGMPLMLGNNKDAWEKFSENAAKLMLDIAFTTLMEEAGDQKNFNCELGDQCYINCENLSFFDNDYQLAISIEKAKRDIKKKLDDGLNALYISIKDNLPCDCILSIGGDHYIKDIVFAACSAFCDSVGNRTRLGKPYKGGTINFAHESLGSLIRHVKKEWKPKFEALKKKGFTFTLNYVSLNDCVKIEARPKQCEEHGWSAFKKYMEENVTFEDVLDTGEWIPYIGGTVQLGRVITDPNADVWDYIVAGYVYLNPWATQNGAMFKRMKQGKDVNVMNIIHLDLAVLSFVPHPALYIGAPLVDALIHFSEMAICYNNNDRRGAVDHFKAGFLDFAFIIPLMKELQLKKMGTLLRNMNKANVKILEIIEKEKETIALSNKLRADAAAFRTKAAPHQTAALSYENKAAEAHVPIATQERHVALVEDYNYAVAEGNLKKMWELEPEINATRVSNAQVQNANANETIYKMLANNEREIASNYMMEANANERSAGLLNQIDMKKYAESKNELYGQFSKEDWIKYHVYFEGNEFYWKKNYPELFSDFVLVEENGARYMQFFGKEHKFKDAFINNSKYFWQTYKQTKGLEYGLAPSLTFGSKYTEFMAYNGVATGAYGAFIASKEDTTKDADIFDEVGFDELECTWSNILMQGLIEAIGDLLFLPRDVLSFITSEEAVHYYNIDEMNAHIKKNYGIVEKKTLIEDLYLTY